MNNLNYDIVWQCLRSRRDPDALNAVRPLLADPRFEWSRLLDHAAAHRVSGLLLDALEGTGLAPPEVMVSLGQVSKRTAFRNLYLLHELGEQLNRLKAAGVDALVLKGAGLAVTAYRTIALRPMVDVDILARREQVPALLKALTAAGYQQDLESRPGAAFEFENELSLRKTGLEPVRLDIHWSLFDSLYYQTKLSLDWYWDSARTATWQGLTIPVPGPEAQLIHLCGHIAMHHAHYPALLWLNDLVEVLWTYREEISWDLLLEKAAEMNLVLPLRAYLVQVAGWGAPIPLESLSRLQALAVSPVEERAFRLHAGKLERSLASRVLPDLVELPAGRRQLRFIRAKLIPSPAYMRERYRNLNVRSLPLLYLIHFWAGLKAGVKIAVAGAAGVVRGLFRPGHQKNGVR